MKGVLWDQVLAFRTGTQELDKWKQKLEVAKAEQQHNQIQTIEKNIRDSHDRLHDTYQAILQSLQPLVAAKIRQAGILGEDRNLIDQVLAKILLKANLKSKNLPGYFLKSCTNEITNYFRRMRRQVPLSWSVASNDGDYTTRALPKSSSPSLEPKSETGEPPTDEERLKIYDPQTYRRQQIDRLVAEYAVRKRELIDSVTFSSPARIATLLTDQRQKTAKLLEQSGYSRLEIPAQTERRELWSDKDPQRDIRSGIQKRPTFGEPTLAEVWEALSEKIQTSQQHIGEQMVVSTIHNCGWAVTRVAWTQRRRRYRAELAKRLDPQNLTFFL